MTWRLEDPEGDESAKVKWDLVAYTRGRGLDLGCGEKKTFPHFIGVDNGHHNVFGYKIKPDVHVDTCEDLSIFGSQSMDFVFSSHLLEHIQDYKAALKEWWRVLKVGGHLCLYLPHKNFYPNIGEKGANPDHKHDFLPEDIVSAMEGKGWDLLVNEDRNEGQEYSFFQVYKKLASNKSRYSYKEPKPEKTVGICRYGAFGDLIQASSILPGLKAQGYHITIHTTSRGAEVVLNDPHIDRFDIQDTDQVPNEQLHDFWEHLKKKYTKFINLSESVEGTLLAIPGRVNHTWPQEVKHKHMNVNYLEFTHDLAGVPFKPSQKFYPTEEEKSWARKEKAKHGPCVLWSLSGSSIHKAWPHLDTILARFMVGTDFKVVLVGDQACQLLEQGWENEPRILKRSGVWTIRETLAFAQVSDLVIGPETGVLNAVGMEDVPKVITLSHSSVENLTKHWKNTTSLAQPTDSDVPCAKSACHMMHYNFDHCYKDEATHQAMCQVNISADQMWNAITEIIEKRKVA